MTSRMIPVTITMSPSGALLGGDQLADIGRYGPAVAGAVRLALRRAGDPHLREQVEAAVHLEVSRHIELRVPDQAEFDAAVRVVLDLLRSEGYGELE